VSIRATALCLAGLAFACLAACGGGGGGALAPIFVQTLTEASPDTGTTRGGTLITLKGTGFLDPVREILAIRFGETAAPSWTILDDETIVVESPPGLRGAVTIYLTGNGSDDDDGVLLLTGFLYKAEIVYVADGPDALVPQLFEVDLDRGTVSSIGPVGFAVEGMATRADGQIWAVEAAANRRLIRIEPATGTGTAVALLRDGVTGAPVEILDVTFALGILFGRTAANDLAQIDLEVGTVTTLLSLAPAPPGGGLALASDGTFLLAAATAGGLLYRHDPVLGTTGPGPGIPGGVVLDALVSLGSFVYGIDGAPLDPAGVDLLRIDPAAGTVLSIAVLPPAAGAVARPR